jgi:hypothetical protein
MKLKLFIAFFIIWFLFMRETPVTYGEGVMAPTTPIQSTSDIPSPFQHQGYTITPLANFSIEARVLSKEVYSHGIGAELSPVDFALGWGRMSDEKILDQIEISQSGRWYRWRTESFPIPRREIETHSANMHMIPANEEIKEALLDVRVGEIVTIEGYLVQVSGKNSFRWRSSLTRKDTGAHACELVFVKSLIKN